MSAHMPGVSVIFQNFAMYFFSSVTVGKAKVRAAPIYAAGSSNQKPPVLSVCQALVWPDWEALI